MNPKFKKNYERTRGYLKDQVTVPHSALLNSLYKVFPAHFETRTMQKNLRRIFAADREDASGLFALNLMRLYQQSPATKIALCSMPKSGSSFFVQSLCRLFEGMERVYLHAPYMNPDFVGAFSCEHEIDELALLILELRQTPWVSHMHTKWTPYTERMFTSFNIKPVVTFRNIFDCLVSMDDMIMARQVAGFPMIRVPRSYHTLCESERLAFLCGYAGPWYIDYVVSWSRAKLPVLRLDYSEDVRGFDEQTGQRLREFMGIEETPWTTIAEAFQIRDDDDLTNVRFNKGISGRGENIPQTARESLRRLTAPYVDEVDFSGLL